MINKRLSKTLGPVIGIMGFMLAIGIMEIPAHAEDNVQNIATSTNTQANITTSAAATINEYSLNINKSETQNGIKVTVDKASATKKNLKVTLKVESNKPLDKLDNENSIFALTYGDSDVFGFTSDSIKYVDDKTMLITLQKNLHKGEYPEKGELRVDLVFSKYKVNIGIDTPVDFTECFKYSLEKDISGKIPELNTTLTKLESDIMGTRIITTSPRSKNNDESETFVNPTIILKIGDKMYKTQQRSDHSDDNKLRLCNYESKSPTYDVVKNEKNISIIPLTCNLTYDQLDDIYSKDASKKITAGKDVSNNINYDKTFDFSNGSKGEIYNIERTDDTVKVYCKGQSEKESLLMASNLRLNYHYDKDTNKEIDDFYNNNNVSFYKDSKEALGYIVEFNGVQKNKNAELNFDRLIKQTDHYKLSDEIKLTN